MNKSTHNKLQRLALDTLALNADLEKDPELKYALEWIDRKALKEGVTVYEIVEKICSKKS